MLALVTGANGFIGSHLVAQLLREGHLVRAMILPGTNASIIRKAGVELVEANMLDASQMDRVVKGVDVVFHLAALPSLAWSSKIYEVNMKGLQQVLEAAIAAKVKRFVFMSSLVVHGFRHFEAADETTAVMTPGRFTRPYIRSKIDGEKMVQAASSVIETVIVRPGFMIYGPNDQLTTKKTLALIGKGRPLFRIGKQALPLSFVYVEKLAYGLFCAGVGERAAGKTFVITDLEPAAISLEAHWQQLAAAAGRSIQVYSLPKTPALILGFLVDAFYFLTLRGKMPPLNVYMVQVASHHIFFSAAAAQRDIGYRQLVSLEEGVSRTVAAMTHYQ